MVIEKIARRKDHYSRSLQKYPSARLAFAAFLTEAVAREDQMVLLPAYIGWSAREGSGVFDPVAGLGLRYTFYRVDRNLRVDLDHMDRILRTHTIRVVVLIHYFGYVDPSYAEAVALARRHGAFVLEDEAHAMLTDLVGRRSGRLGDASIFSLHKMLPVESGGMLVINGQKESVPPMPDTMGSGLHSPWSYDLAVIAQKRSANAEFLHERLLPLAEDVEPLWGLPRPGEIPQTYPVLIKRASRDRLYFAMNETGFGVVSLYHTMVNAISKAAFPDSYQISRTILNLPVHQDVEPDMLAAMVGQLGKCLGDLS